MDEKGKDKIVFKKEDIFLLPNLITYFRILCIPVFVVLCIVGGLQNRVNLVYWSLGVFAIAALSDLVDGKIARKYNMISDIGKVFDPLADKLMHIFVMLSLTIIGYMPWYFIFIVALKEALMVFLSPVLLKKQIVIQAVFAGKIASFVLSIGVLANFFHPLLTKWWTLGTYKNISLSIDWIIMLIGCLFAVYAGITYMVIMRNALKKFKIDLANGKVDKYGNRLDKEGC